MIIIDRENLIKRVNNLINVHSKRVYDIYTESGLTRYKFHTIMDNRDVKISILNKLQDGVTRLESEIKEMARAL